MLALASLGLSTPKGAGLEHDASLVANNVNVAGAHTPRMGVKLGLTNEVTKSQCTSTKLDDDEHELAKRLMEIEFRWTIGGYFDGVYMSNEMNSWVSGAKCTNSASFALKLVMNLRDVITDDIGVLPGGGPTTPGHKIRYFPSDSLLRYLYGCADHVHGHDCSNHTQAALLPCVPGSSKMLVDTQFMTVQNDPRFSCIRAIPNKYQRSGFAAKKAWDAWEMSRGSSFASRHGKALYVGSKIEGATQRANLYNHTNWYRSGPPIAEWLVMPGRMGMKDAVKYRYLIDIGGSSGTTWDALMWKMASGALVFKVKPQSDARDFWNADMHPGSHYIEVMPDLSDLHEKWNWAASNPVEAERIAVAGQKYALQWASKEYAVRRLEDVLRDEFNYPPRESYHGAQADQRV